MNNAVPPNMLTPWLPLLVGAVTALGAVIAVLVGKHLDLRLLIQQEQRKRKAEIYQEWITYWTRLYIEDALVERVSNGATTEVPYQVSREERYQFQTQCYSALALWASDEVMGGLARLMGWQESGGDPNAYPLMMGAISLAMRRDLGHPNRELKETDMLRLMIRDFAKFGVSAQ